MLFFLLYLKFQSHLVIFRCSPIKKIWLIEFFVSLLEINLLICCKTAGEWLEFIALKVKLKLATEVEGNRKAPFSIATTLKCRGGRYFFSLDCTTLPSIRTLYCCVLSKEVSSATFKVFGMTRAGIEPRSPGPLANTTLAYYWTF